MFKSRPLTTETRKTRSPLPMKEFATEGLNIPLKKNWSDSWCSLPEICESVLPEILNYEVRPDDVFVVTFMKCGTTWMQETAWLLINNLDYEKSKQFAVLDRSPFLEDHGIVFGARNAVEYSHSLPSPRLLKSHMPASLLPLQLWERKQKTIYVARNCKDVVVSSYHFMKKLGLWSGDNMEDYVNDFINNELNYTSYWNHIVDFWKMRNEPHIFFVTYEEMKKDLASVIQRLCTFLERPQLTAEEMERTLDHLSFDKMRSYEKMTNDLKEKIPKATEDFQFLRRGIVGSFKDELTPELREKIDNWSQNYLAQHGLTEEDIFGKL
ncbi:sulfotransferase 1 family member D1-like [Musca autumnalis]|uniref:sulfotransferase 1 family member D1-like n=1 Tax=Musca autumnalis TaxID=221902 RepID=UPI003CF6ACC3